MEQSEIDGTGENAAGGTGTTGSENTDPEGNLPKTNETKNAAFSLLGALLVSMVGLSVFGKKEKPMKKSTNRNKLCN
ncbi:MAG: LPXTG cell wall anchor domain-containing protein [Enterococcus lacertideformus]|uniref:LPXTG cell wall anchor domain-containing protein n=1 Tax=Enterococcus lacertideformus TaxID=2771493 RepID=A0A931AWE7_9ENTE|nr:LPXTG cell wall anchor domain-containing protein [Enterococcus lacertideformus]